MAGQAVYNPPRKWNYSHGGIVSATQKILRFGVFELNLDAEELRRSGTLIKLAPQPIRLLAVLASHAGQIVTREEIKEQIWGEETYVDFEQGMNHCIKQIRTVLGDNADNPLYVETLPRRGYRFLAPVVSKNVLAPAPTIIKSQSGVQSGVMRAVGPDGTPIAPKPPDTPPRVEVAAGRKDPLAESKVASRNERVPASGMFPAAPAQAVAYEESPALRRDATSAAAAAEALAPEIARLRKSPNRARRIVIWIAAALAGLMAAVLYWELHKP
jgi:DNA-binding winged helix-turn-helix (wHTH) protein